MTIMELREKRNKALDAAKAFLESHRTDKGVLSVEDDATYTKMEANIDALTNEIHRLERQEQREAEMNKPINTPLTSKPSDSMAPEKKGRASDAYKEGMLTALRTNSVRYLISFRKVLMLMVVILFPKNMTTA